MRYLVAFCLLALSSSALAAGPSIYRCKNGVISVGSTSTGQIVQKCGEPNRVSTIENGFGAAMGERWEYWIDGKTLILTIQRSQLVAIQELR